MGFWDTLKNGGFGNSGGIKGLGEEIKERLNVDQSSGSSSSSSSSTSTKKKVSDSMPTTVPTQKPTITKEDRRRSKRQLENLVDMVSPKAAEKLKKVNRKIENVEDTVENVIDGNTPSKIAVRVLTEAKDFSRGDHLYVQRVGFTHHGLYVGNGQVIHYLLEEGIVKTTLEEFAAGANVHLNDSPVFYSPTKVVNRAYSRLGEFDYNLIHNNCENFVNWCRSGS